MEVALFLDGDKKLTKNFIQEEYAKFLGCENECRDIESDFQKNEASVEFGEWLISLF